MFGLSFGEIAIIAVLALLLLGPERLPEAAKTIGKGLRDFRRATEDLKGQIETEIYADEQKTPKPSLVPPVPAKPSEPAGPPPAASAENVPGLDIALLEPLSEPPPEPASEPAPAAVAAAPTAPETKPT
ncbi:MAG TPA: twin-arginine translocase TatA/TatE family subunit [Anaeromyxobacteraceae bacterium]|nr:twin-arginine translocase TatA/TatE family subunit [Anaeromyxobacteraceae bacterium]